MSDISPYMNEKTAIHFVQGIAQSLQAWLKSYPEKEWARALAEEMQRLLFQTMQESLADYGITTIPQIRDFMEPSIMGVCGYSLSILQRQHGTTDLQSTLEAAGANTTIRLLLIASLAEMMMNAAYSALDPTPEAAKGLHENATQFFNEIITKQGKTTIDQMKAN